LPIFVITAKLAIADDSADEAKAQLRKILCVPCRVISTQKVSERDELPAAWNGLTIFGDDEEG